MQILNKNIQKIIKYLGYTIVRNNALIPADYINNDIKPYEAYVDNEKRPVVIKVNPLDCRDWLGLPFDNCIKCYIPDAIKQFSNFNNPEQKLSEYFYEFYSYWFERYLFHALDIDRSELNLKTSFNAFYHIFPWSKKELEMRFEKRFKVASKQSMEYKDIQGSSILQDKPDVIQLSRLRAKQLSSLLVSISKKGYLRNNYKDGDITADLLIGKDEQVSFFIRSGNHRLYTLSSLDYKAVPVRITGSILRSESKYWPQVTRGLMSEDTALKIFDRVLKGGHSAYE